MKKIIILAISILLILPILSTYSYAENLEMDNELMIVAYCPGAGSKDGRHHFFRSYRNTSVTLKDNNGKKVGRWDGIPCNCKYCNAYVWVSLDLKEYISGNNIKTEGMTGYWAYAKDVHPVYNEEMVFFE